MKNDTMTKEEIALELVKLISAPSTSSIAYLESNAEKIANAYNKVLTIISTPQSK